MLVNIKNHVGKYFSELRRLAYEAIEWIISGAIIGTSVGMLMLFFRFCLVNLIKLTNPAFNNFYLTLILPAVSLFLVGLIIEKLPIIGNRGTNFIIRKILKHKKTKLRALPFKFIATLLTICFGGSAGREGPALQMSVYIGDFIAQKVKFKTIKQEYIIISAVSASFGAMFHAPIAGAVFGCEVLLLRGIKYEPLLTCMFSSLFAYLISWTFYPEPLLVIPSKLLHYNVSISEIPILVLFALLIGIIGPMYIALYRLFQYLFKMIKIKIFFKTMIGGLLTGCIIWAVHYYTKGEYSVHGMSIKTLEKLLMNSAKMPILVLLFVMIGKMLAVNLTLGSGASGGLVMPTFFFGTCFGILFADILGVDPLVYGATGMLGFFGAVTHVPLAMTFLATELFSSDFLMPTAIVGLIGSWILSYYSLYPAVERNTKIFN